MSKRHPSRIVTGPYEPLRELQRYGMIVSVPSALDASVRGVSIANLKQLLVDTLTLRDLYNTHHWHVSGPTLYQLHRLFDKHLDEQSGLVDFIAGRIQSLGGVSIAMTREVTEMTLIPRPPRGRDDDAVRIARLLRAHEIVLKEARATARQTAAAGDGGTNDLLVSDVIPTNERQVWFVGEHLAGTPLIANEHEPA